MTWLVTPQIPYTDFNWIDQNWTVIVQKATKEELKSPLEKAWFINTSELIKWATQLVLKLAKGQWGIINCTRDKTWELNEECAFETYYVADSSNRLMVPKQPTKEKLSKTETFVQAKWEVQWKKYLIEQCDWIGRDWIIHDNKKNWIIKWFPEKKCVRKNELAQKKKEIAQKEKEVEKWMIILAQMDMSIENLKKELKRIEEEIQKWKKRLEKWNRELKERRERLKEQIRKAQKSFS